MTKEEILKQHEEIKNFQNNLEIFFKTIVQKSLKEWREILPEKDYLIALKTKYLYSYIRANGTKAFSYIEKEKFHKGFIEKMGTYNLDERFIYSEEYGFVEIKEKMFNSCFGRSENKNRNLRIHNSNILIYSMDYTQYNGFGSVVSSYSQSIEYNIETGEVEHVDMDRKDISNLYSIGEIINYNIL